MEHNFTIRESPGLSLKNLPDLILGVHKDGSRHFKVWGVEGLARGVGIFSGENSASLRGTSIAWEVIVSIYGNTAAGEIF